MVHKYDMKISMILATDIAGCIGKDNQIPWKLKDDMKFFRETTTGFPVIMGRKTADSLGKPLPNRENWVLSKNNDLKWAYETLGFKLTTSLDGLIHHLNVYDHKKAFIIGGAQIYDLALDMDIVDEIYHTWVDVTIKGGDTFIKSYFDLKKFDREKIARFEVSDRNDFGFTIYKLVRNTKK
jgi:dihydrofolate reductase